MRNAGEVEGHVSDLSHGHCEVIVLGQPRICRLHVGSYSGVAGDLSRLECDAVLVRSQFPTVQKKSRKALNLHLPKDGDSFSGDHGVCVEKGSGEGHLSPKGPCWENWSGARIPGTLKDE